MTLDLNKLRFGSELIKRGFSAMTKGGVIMDVTTADQAKIAEAAGAVAVMALERVPADIRAAGGVARMADPMKIKEIMDAVSIPVMAKVRIGHISEAYVLEKIGVDMLDESEVLTPADPFFHLYKKNLTVPVVSGARNLPEAVRRIFEGAAMIRTKGEAGTGNIIEAVRHIRKVNEEISVLKRMSDEQLRAVASNISASYFVLREEASKDLMGVEGKLSYDSAYAGMGRSRIEREILAILRQIRRMGRLPVVNFAAGGVATPADGALMMELGADGVFVGSGIFKSPNPEKMARSIVEAVENYRDYDVVEKASEGLQGMPGVDIESIPKDMRLQERGW
ncbi:probable pyridoxine biosynthesis pyroA protein [Thermoplasma acidophilum]|uniref:Pyridoxal 5'-phosphate synthase subunit PdxS n=1 Tax=Thermoplasma acidophilum (strain ATCC 25905 / DSM 1728 / JCM 9062 / NBRC 15155 / AMRC-C165) TaxID=273075 RepID=PDXS_THEAC|nr:pyridoxal 5'-phosphate synthase lyase subunit PdxS [Thermoplasma acidophilum]Q9HKS5.1 RecName: Full=Pyridoxal 5'-phosphate synthase subunit PdxS; Short=PLP synthase subunit PdxS; AltName: Full=Pdx1 [Thermoplasma acidophilum DSM 1728]CAC11661.1 probable pyridoxine biosynthesis pyroA protein [Thermoplasma acidophilum]